MPSHLLFSKDFEPPPSSDRPGLLKEHDMNDSQGMLTGRTLQDYAGMTQRTQKSNY